jgi:hypothetical protein
LAQQHRGISRLAKESFGKRAGEQVPARHLHRTQWIFAREGGMLQESAGPRSSGYLVPCVFKAVQMIEALRKT